MKACPSGKRRWRDRVAALAVLASIQATDDTSRPSTEQRAYRCPRCRGWHLTSKESR